jgi:hypothetical protein
VRARKAGASIRKVVPVNTIQTEVTEVFANQGERQASETAPLEDRGVFDHPGRTAEDISGGNGMIHRRADTSAEAPSVGPKKKLVIARQFLMSFRERPDDIYLMDKYSLNPKQLKKVYNALIEKGWLEEYEYHTRDRKAPELEEPTVNLGDMSTNVTVKGSFTEDTLELYRSHSSLNLTQTDGRGRTQGVPPAGRSSAQKSPGATGQIKLVPHDDLCPNCRREKHPSSPDSCIACGVVFSKYAAIKKKTAVPIWDMDSEL